MQPGAVWARGRCALLWSVVMSSLTFTMAQEPAPAPPAADAAAPRGGIAWEGDYDAALERAKREDKPLFVAFLMDDEPGNDLTIDKNYVDPDVIKLSKKFVCLACCIGDHPGEGGGCRKFKGVTCAQHRAIEKQARARWLVGSEVSAPQHVFCDPQGTPLLRKVFYIDVPTLKKCMALALVDKRDPDAEAVLAEEKARVDAWIADVGGNNLEVRMAALRSLAWCDDPRALPTILRFTKPPADDVTRTAAIAALGSKGNYLAVSALTELLLDKKAMIVIASAGALETIQMPESTPGLLAALKKEKRDRVRGFLLRAVAHSSPENETVRDLCLRALKGASAQLEPCVLIALGRLTPHDRVVAAARPFLADKNVGTRGLAVWVLGCQRTPACAELLDKLIGTEKAPEVMAVAVQARQRCRGEKVEGYDLAWARFFSASDY